MSTLKLAVLRNELEYLQQCLGDPSRYLRAIRNGGYLTERECQLIKSGTTNREKIELFISILCSQKSNEVFDIFVAELRKQRVDVSIAIHLRRETASKWLCYHCKSLNQLQSWECEKCDLPKTCTDSMDKAVSKDFVQNQLYRCSRCEAVVEIASLPANRQLDEFKICYKCLKQANPEAANEIVEIYQPHSHTGGSKPIFVDQPPCKISVHAGEDLTLRCEAIGTPLPKYQWFDSQRNPLEGKNQPTLVIEKVTQAVEGYYICRAVSCPDSKCTASNCCNFSEWTNVIVSSPSQSSKAEANLPTYLQQPGQYELSVHPYQLPQAIQQQQFSSQVQIVIPEVMQQQNGSLHSQAYPHVGGLHKHMQPQPTLPSQSQPHTLPQEPQHEWLAQSFSSQSESPPQFHPSVQGLSNCTPLSQPIGLLHQQYPTSQPYEQSPARMHFPGQLQQHPVKQNQHRAQVLQPQSTTPQDSLQPRPLHIQPPPPTNSTLQAQPLPHQQFSSQVQNVKPEVLQQQHSSLPSQAYPHVGGIHMHMQPQPTLPSDSLPQEPQQGSPSQSGSPPQFHPSVQGLSNWTPSPQPIGLLHQQCPTSQPNELSPAQMRFPGQLQQHPVQQAQHRAQVLQPQSTMPQDSLQPRPLHIQPPPPTNSTLQAQPLPHQQFSSQVQNVKPEVLQQQNSSLHSQAYPHVGGIHMHMQPQPTLPSDSLPQEPQHAWLARGSPPPSGSPPQLSNCTPSPQPIGLLHPQCPTSQPNEQSPAQMCFPGQLQQHPVQQNQHRAQVLRPQSVTPQDLPLQPPPLHIQPPSPTNSTLQAQPLPQSKSLYNPNAQQVSSLLPQQNLQAQPHLEQFNSPPPKFKPVPKPRKRPPGLLKSSDSTPANSPATVPGPEMLHGTPGIELPGTIRQPSTIDAITLECHHNPPTSKSKKLLDDALKDGFILADITNVLCIGSAGVGKTHLKFLLLRKRPPIHRRSTPCAEAAIRVVACSRMCATQQDELREVSLDELRVWLAQSASTGVILERHFPVTHSQEPELVNSSDISDPENLPDENAPSSCSSSSSPSIVKPDEPTRLAETNRILQLMNRHVLHDNDEFGLNHIHWVHFVDSGGQPQFHEVLPAFIRNTSLSLVVFKLSEALSDFPDTEFYTAEQECFKLGRFSQTNEEIIQHVAKSIQSHQFSSHPGSSHEIDHASQKQPRFMLVGTFKDEEHSCPESLQDKNEKLKRSLRPFEDIYFARSNKEIIFPVNGLLAGPDDQDPVAKDLRKAIIGSKQHITVKIPIRWYFLQLEIRALEKNVVTIQECWEIAQKLHFRSRDELTEALEYIHDVNLIMYFRAVLPDIVFCDPQLLLNKVSQLIEFSFYLNSSKTIQIPAGLTFGMQRRLAEQGTFAPEFLDVNSDGYIAGVFSSSDLLKLLEHLLLVAEIKEVGTPDEYFMPSLLPLLSSNEISELSRNTPDSNSFAKPLIVYFPDGWSPNGLFCAVIVFLLSSENRHLRWKFLTQSRCYNSQLHLKNGRNFAKFSIQDYPGVVTIINSGRHFEIHTTCPGNLCPVIKRCIFEGITKVRTRFTYSFKCRVAFFCPCGSPLHLAELGADHNLICTRNRAICYDELTRNYTIWLEAHIEEPVAGTPSSWQIERDAPPDLRVLMNRVSTRTTKWREVGIELSISTPQLNAISYEVRTVQQCFEHVFELWKSSTSMPYTWDTLITALKAPQVNEQRLASEIEQSLT